MNSILTDLYLGNINPSGDINPTSKDYHAMLQKILDELAYFKQNLSPDDYKRVDNLVELINDSNAVVTETAFIYSFKLGTKIMLDVLL